jgi:hypothetical protein
MELETRGESVMVFDHAQNRYIGKQLDLASKGIQGYHISKGKDDIFWILNHDEDFIKNLSIDKEQAITKAKEFLRSINEPDDIKISVWYRDYESGERLEFNFPKYINYYDKHWFYFLYLERQQEAKNAKLEQLKHIGNINDKVELELTITDMFSYKIHLEHTFLPIFQTCYKFSDSDNNRFIYFGTIELGQKFDNIKIKATIKQHTTDKYNSLIKLTVLKRPKLITEFQADNKIQVSAGMSTNNNPESKTNGEKQ